VNRRLRVELELADGTRGDWPLVHLGDLGPLRAVWWGRHRKLQESLLLRKPTILRASFCDHVARRWVDAHPAGPDPVAIRLYCATAAVRPPGSADPFGTPGPETLVYTHRVQVVVRAQACAPDDPGAPAAVGMLVAAR